MGFSLQVFVSSACYELRDLRATIKSWLTQLGLSPLMSDEGGFPHIDRMPPYATCLRVIEECPLVIGVIDRQYGQAFDDWGPYTQHRGRSPTHAELRHALDIGKRVLIYVRGDTWNFYEVWRKNPEAFREAAPNGLDERTLEMFQELKSRSPAPWIEHFSDAADLVRSLNSEFVNQLYSYLHDREREATDQAGYFLEKILEATPQVRDKIVSGLSPTLIVERDALSQKLAEIEFELEKTKGVSKDTIAAIEQDKATALARLDIVSQQMREASLLLARSAMKDASWLDFVRRTMLPKQPGRVPFHNAAEVALRGFHTAGSDRIPSLATVTWQKLPQKEHGLHRGYTAGLVFRGDKFAPGITFARRRRGETNLPSGNSDYIWMQPNIYFGEYLEVSASDDDAEGPLSWRDYEFQVKNPEGRTSDWVLFSYSFDDDKLTRIRDESFQQGTALLVANRPAEAIEPLRKAYVFSDRMLGAAAEETLKKKLVWERARNEAALAKLRFRVGDVLTVTTGPHAGKSGTVDRLLLNHFYAYVIKPSEGEMFQAADDQVAVAGSISTSM